MTGWTEQHAFEPRLKGSKDACRICGGRKEDPIHDVSKKPRRQVDE